MADPFTELARARRRAVLWTFVFVAFESANLLLIGSSFHEWLRASFWTRLLPYWICGAACACATGWAWATVRLARQRVPVSPEGSRGA